MTSNKKIALFEQGCFSGCNFILSLLILYEFNASDFVNYNNILMIVYVLMGVSRNYISIQMIITDRFCFKFYFFILMAFILLSTAIFMLVDCFYIENIFFNLLLVFIGFVFYEFSRRIMYKFEMGFEILFLGFLNLFSLSVSVFFLYFYDLSYEELIRSYFSLMSLSLIFLMKLRADNSSFLKSLNSYLEGFKNASWLFMSGMVYSFYNQFFYLYASRHLSLEQMSVLYFLRTTLQPVQVLIAAFDSIDKIKFKKNIKDKSFTLKYMQKVQHKLILFCSAYCFLIGVSLIIYSVIEKIDLSIDYLIIFICLALVYMSMTFVQPMESILIVMKKSVLLFFLRVFGTVLMLLALCFFSDIYIVFSMLFPWVLISIVLRIKIKNMSFIK
jgi:hypothetical protein